MKTERKAHNFERAKDEWYVEPRAVTAQLLRYETFEGHTHDPCCGGGHIPATLHDAGLTVTGSDLRSRRGQAGSPWFAGNWDFMDPHTLGLLGARNAVFNPPYYKNGGMERFIVRALSLAPGKVCVFTPLRFLTGNTRAKNFYLPLRPDRIWIITPRPSCPPGEYLEAGGTAKGDTKDYIWLVWDERQGRSETLWMI